MKRSMKNALANRLSAAELLEKLERELRTAGAAIWIAVLYPLMVTAAVTAILFSAIGIATMLGYLPGVAYGAVIVQH